MRTVKLHWFHAVPVVVLYESLKPDSYYRNPNFPELNEFGFYMYLEKDTAKAKYIGQAYDSPPLSHRRTLSLRRRVRWEIVKDGIDCAKSAFYFKCKKYGVDRLSLLLKVAHLESAQVDGKEIIIDQEFMNAVEAALIFERAQTGDLLMNETHTETYGLGPIDIMNYGEITPLPPRIVLE